MKLIERFTKRVLLQVVSWFRSSRKTDPGEIPVNFLKRILIIRQHDQLGDLLIATPTIRAVRRRFPDAYIGVVVREYTVPLIWDNPHVDEIIVFYEKLKKWNFQMVRLFLDQLRRDGGYDCAIVLNTVSRSLSSDIIAVLSKAKYIIGPDHLKLLPDAEEKVYNVLTHRSDANQLEIDHNLDIVKSFGVQPDGYEYDLSIDDEERTEAERVYRSLNIDGTRLVIGIHFGTLDETRRFPINKISQLIDWIKTNTDHEVVLIIGPNEVKMRDSILRITKSKVLCAPVMPLRVCAAFIQKMNLFLCNDTGTLHIAAAMQVPTVSFHSTNDPAVWKPPHERHIAVRADDAKITSIPLDLVIDAVTIQIDKIRNGMY